MDSNAGVQSNVEIYDDFSITTPDGEPTPGKWVIGQMVVDGQVIWTWRDENLQVSTGSGYCELNIPVFSAEHHEVGIFDNPKVLFCSSKVWQHGGRPIRFESRMSGEFNGDLSDYRDGFAGFHVLDFNSGTVMDVVGNGNRLWAIVERLPIPGLDSPVEPFIEFHDLGIQSAPGMEHGVAVEYDPQSRMARWIVDGKVGYEREILMNPQSFFLAFGLLTLHEQVDGRSVSNKGQGGRGKWGPFTVTRG